MLLAHLVCGGGGGEGVSGKMNMVEAPQSEEVQDSMASADDEEDRIQGDREELDLLDHSYTPFLTLGPCESGEGREDGEDTLPGVVEDSHSLEDLQIH